MEPMEERRRAKRTLSSIDARLHDAENNKSYVDTFINNISISGCLLFLGPETKIVKKIGKRYQIEIQLPHRTGLYLTVNAKLARIKGSMYGFQFLDLTTEDANELSELQKLFE